MGIAWLSADLLTVAGCNKASAAGKDIQRGGEAVQAATKDVQNKM
ncbi:MAG TPA: entericidin [Betaproteobacteria bacterium]|nr:entericidin [Betaproteobacteria bacterium]